MRVIPSSSAAVQEVTMAGAEGATLRELITQREGAPTFAMRLFEVQPGGHTPLHTHAWEHEVFILQGAGQLVSAAERIGFAAGDAVFVPPSEEHQFLNTGQELLRFLCVIPIEQSCCR